MKNFTKLSSLITAAVGVVVLATASPAAAASGTVTGTWVSEGAGYSAVYQGQNAVVQNIKIENGDTVKTFCVDLAKGFDDAASFTASPRSAAGTANLSKAAWIAVNSANVPGALADADLEAVAVQVAIWKFTNNATLDLASIPNADVLARASVLTNAAQDLPEGPSSFNLTATTRLVGSNVETTATLVTAAGAPISNQSVKVTHGSVVKTANTNASGIAVISSPAGSGSSISVDWSGQLPAGTVLMPSNASQPVITAQPAGISRSVQLAAPAAAPTTTVAPAQPTLTSTPEAPTATPQAVDAPVEELPYTGISETVTPFLALGALALAGAAFYAYRRFATN